MMKKQLPNIIKIPSLILGISLSIFMITFVVSAAWTQPPESPPNCPSGQPGCDIPVHVGSTTQAKSGALGIGGVFQTNSNTYLAAANGNVGIGTTSPDKKVTIQGGHTTTQLRMHADNGANTDANLYLFASEPGLTYHGVGISNNWRWTGSSPFSRENTGIGASYIRLLDGTMHFNVVTSGGTNTNAMFVQNNGNVGIGTTSPGAQLDVRKNARFYDSSGNMVLIIE